MCRDCSQYGVLPTYMQVLHPGKSEMNREGNFWDDIIDSLKDDKPSADESRKKESTLLEKMIRAGNKDANDLTNQIFFKRHPELGGKKLTPTQSAFQELSNEWLVIRDTLVLPTLRKFGQGTTSSSELSRFLQLTKHLIPFIEKDRGRIPLAYILAWIKIESGGKIETLPTYAPGHIDLDERGYFQISIQESQKMGFDHKRLSFDPQYSVQAGIKLINFYANAVRSLGITDANPIFWKLVKLWHAASGIATYAVRFAKEKGHQMNDWTAFKRFILETEWSNFEKRLAVFRNIPDKKGFVIRLINNVDKLFQWEALIQPAITK